jgi:hypothetical protein
MREFQIRTLPPQRRREESQPRSEVVRRNSPRMPYAEGEPIVARARANGTTVCYLRVENKGTASRARKAPACSATPRRFHGGDAAEVAMARELQRWTPVARAADRRGATVRTSLGPARLERRPAEARRDSRMSVGCDLSHLKHLNAQAPKNRRRTAAAQGLGAIANKY